MSAKVFLGSVFVSILILAPAAYFILPMLYPNMKETQAPGEDDGNLVQNKFVVFNSPAYIYDDAISDYVQMPDTQTIITTEGDSSLVVLFTATALLSLMPTFTGRSSYNVSLVINGVGNRTIMIHYFDSAPATGFYRELTYDLAINFATGTLAAGNYSVGLYWKSTWDATGTNSLSVNHDPSYQYDRSLWIQEIKN